MKIQATEKEPLVVGLERFMEATSKLGRWIVGPREPRQLSELRSPRGFKDEYQVLTTKVGRNDEGGMARQLRALDRIVHSTSPHAEELITRISRDNTAFYAQSVVERAKRYFDMRG